MRIFLFGYEWKSSIGSNNYWKFFLDEDVVRWSYDVLFDANTREYSHGATEFPKNEFRVFLETVLACGRGNIYNEHNRNAHFRSNDDGTFFTSVFADYGVSAYGERSPISRKDIENGLAMLKAKLCIADA